MSHKAGMKTEDRVGRPAMSRKTRKDDWGFPRWREYGSTHEAVKLRMCDRHGCSDAGVCPAPKAPNSPERWWFCATHAGEYNSGWNYFEGLTAEEAAEREADEQRDASGFQQAKHYGWGGSGDGSRSRDEMRALDAFGLESDADFETVKAAWRKVAKESHPDVNPGNAEAAKIFQTAQAAYDVLRAAEERRLAL